jgi:lysophospholipase L1-like esterase
MSRSMDERPKARPAKRLLVVALSLLAGLAALEVVVRVRHGTPMRERLPLMRVRANAHRGWEMVPGEEHYTYEHRVRVNALGLRGPEVGAKRAGETRVLFLGDSLTYGQGVGEEDTVPAALERALRAADAERDWSVVNGGNRAYGTAQEVGLLTELGARIAPDVVLLGWYWNDVQERDIETTYAAFRDRGPFEFDVSGALAGWPRLRWQLLQVPRSSALVMLVHDLLSTKGEVFPPEVADAGFRRLGPLLERMRAECARLGAVPVFVLFPDPQRLSGRLDTQPYEQRAAALARETALPVIELLPALADLHAETRALPIVPFDGHYDARANRAMAAHLAAELLRLGVPSEAD